MYKISVVIPLYNHSQYIAECISSVISQTQPPDEIVVVNDGSTDDSHDVMEQLARRHSNIIYWNRSNQGAHSALNAAIYRSSGDIVAILNSDDLYAPTRLADCVSVFANASSIDAVSTALSFIDGASRPRENAWYNSHLFDVAHCDNLALALLNANILMTTSNLVFRRSLFDTIGGFRNLRYAHDLDYFMKLLRSGRRFYYIDRPLVQYRIHGRNTIGEDHSAVRAEWAAIIAEYMASGALRDDVNVYRRLLDIVDRHSLGRLVMAYLLYLQQPDRYHSPLAIETIKRISQEVLP